MKNRLIGMCLKTNVRRPDLESGFRVALEEFGVTPARFGETGGAAELGRLQLRDYGERGAWLFFWALEESGLNWARAIALELESEVLAHELIVFDQPAETYDGDPGYAYRYHERTLWADGQESVSDAELDGDGISGGDFHETLTNTLELVMPDRNMLVESSPRWILVDTVGQQSDVPQRVLKLARKARTAGGYKLVEMLGQTMVQIQLPDGSKQTSAVKPGELEQLRDLVGPPSDS